MNDLSICTYSRGKKKREKLNRSAVPQQQLQRVVIAIEANNSSEEDISVLKKKPLFFFSPNRMVHLWLMRESYSFYLITPIISVAHVIAGALTATDVILQVQLLRPLFHLALLRLEMMVMVVRMMPLSPKTTMKVFHYEEKKIQHWGIIDLKNKNLGAVGSGR